MKIIEALNQIDALKANAYAQADKVKWLSILDGKVKVELIDTHEGGDDVTFAGYTEDTPLDTELLVPAPYDEVYLRWLEAQIDYANGEYDKFNNSITMYNASYMAYENFYNRKHMPIGRKFKCF